MDLLELHTLAKHKALGYSLDPVLVCAVVEQESSWNTWSARFERAWAMRLMGPEGAGLLSGFKGPATKETEIAGRSHSWGLMQVLGQTAREQGCNLPFLNQLCDPEFGLDFGCKVLAMKLKVAVGDVRRGLLFYNGGGNHDYPGQVLARMKNYQEVVSG